jgi:hypothetical protein
MKEPDMTGAELDAIPAGTVFKTGEIVDAPEGVNMHGTGRMLKFVAVKGYANDWAVYCHWAHHDEEFIRGEGQKIVGSVNIRRCVPCSNEVIARYRY